MRASDSCGICYQPLDIRRTKVFCSSCGLAFHRNCIINLQENQCPVCRNQFAWEGPSSNQDEDNQERRYRSLLNAPWWKIFLSLEIIILLLSLFARTSFQEVGYMTFLAILLSVLIGYLDHRLWFVSE